MIPKDNRFRPSGGRIPPQNLAAEEAVLGALLLQPKDAIEELSLITALGSSGQMFYKDSNREIFESCIRLAEFREPIDIISVKSELQQAGKLEMSGGVYYLTELSTKVASAANIGYHWKLIVEAAKRRKVIEVCESLMGQSFDDTKDVFQLIESYNIGLQSLEEGIVKVSHDKLGDAFDEYFTELEALKARIDSGETAITGLTFGSEWLDYHTLGANAGQLVVVAARPGMGKTSLALSAILAGAMAGNVEVIYSFEMSPRELFWLIVCKVANVPNRDLISGKISAENLKKVKDSADFVRSLPIYIEDCSGQNVILVAASVGAHHRKHKGKRLRIWIDYLQKMGETGNKRNNREREISLISGKLKEVAQQYKIPVIALAQLNRECEKRVDKMPRLSDLRESGAIEQDADLIMFLWRPWHYMEKDESFAHYIRSESQLSGVDDRYLQEIGICIVGKFRQGNLGQIPLRFNGPLLQYSDFQDYRQYLDIGYRENQLPEPILNLGYTSPHFDGDDFEPIKF